MSEQGFDSVSGDASPASREAMLSELFVALADTLVADFDVLELLERLLATCVDLFEVSAAAVLILDAKRRLRLVASSSERAEQLELFQIQVDEGPCLDCARTRTAVIVEDLQAETWRWPRFCAAAQIVGFRAVHAVPLRLREEGLGTLGLFHRDPLTLPPRDGHAVQALADVATIGLLQQRHAKQAEIVNDQLQGALDSRVAIEQAKGVVAEVAGVSMETAFLMLRTYCRDRNLKLSDVATRVADRGIAGSDIVAGTRHRGA